MSAELLRAEPGTVVRYRPPYDPTPGVDVMWCREGMAVALDNGLLLDTYWGTRDGPPDKYVRVAWFDSVEVLGNLADYRRADRYEDVTAYHPSDRLTVTRQHRLQRDEYVRVGAVPHYGTRVRAQVAKVRQARDELRSAQWSAEWAERDLRQLLAERES